MKNPELSWAAATAGLTLCVCEANAQRQPSGHTPPAESIHSKTVRFLSSISCRGTLPNKHLREGRKITADPLFFMGWHRPGEGGGRKEVYYTLVNLNPCITACFRVVSKNVKLCLSLCSKFEERE